MAFPDSQSLIFSDPFGKEFVYSTPISIRETMGGRDVIRCERLVLIGSLDLGLLATTAIFVLEGAATADGTFSPAGYLGPCAIDANVALAELCELRWFLNTNGPMPSISFSPDNRFFRLGVQFDQPGGSVTMQAFIFQKSAR